MIISKLLRENENAIVNVTLTVDEVKEISDGLKLATKTNGKYERISEKCHALAELTAYGAVAPPRKETTNDEK